MTYSPQGSSEVTGNFNSKSFILEKKVLYILWHAKCKRTASSKATHSFTRSVKIFHDNAF